MSAKSGQIELSVVVPVFDEEGSLVELVAELRPVLLSITPSHEIVFVDDGSKDGGVAILDELARTDPRVVVWRFDRNHGLSSALHCGFLRARGRILATLDADLQNDPRDLPRLVDAIRAGADMACGWRKVRQDPFVKRASSRIANAWRSARTGDGIHDVTCPMKALRREVREVFHPFTGMHRFLPTLAIAAGFKVVEIPVGHRARRHGSSKFGIGNRLFRGLRDLRAVKWMLERRMTYKAVRVGGPRPESPRDPCPSRRRP
jgi:glycosyltransferase involved in cell wall biosynthesis